MSLHTVDFFVHGEDLTYEVKCSGVDDDCAEAAHHHYGDPTKCVVVDQINPTNVGWCEAVDPDLQRPHRILIRGPIEVSFRVEHDGDNFTVYVSPRLS